MSSASPSVPKTRALITGANGFVGRVTVETLQKSGLFEITCATRSPLTDVRAGNTALVIEDFLGDFDWEAALKDIDVVIHVAGAIASEEANADAELMRTNRDITERVAKAAGRASIDKFIFLSTLSVHSQINNRVLTPSSPVSYCDPYPASKHAGELAAASVLGDTTYMIVRPPMVIGKEPSGSFTRIARICARLGVSPFGRFTEHFAVIRDTTLATFIGAAALSESAESGVYMPQEAKSYSAREIVDLVAELSDSKVRHVPVPLLVLRGLGRVTGQAGSLNDLFAGLKINDPRSEQLMLDSGEAV